MKKYFRFQWTLLRWKCVDFLIEFKNDSNDLTFVWHSFLRHSTHSIFVPNHFWEVGPQSTVPFEKAPNVNKLCRTQFFLYESDQGMENYLHALNFSARMVAPKYLNPKGTLEKNPFSKRWFSTPNYTVAPPKIPGLQNSKKYFFGKRKFIFQIFC